MYWIAFISLSLFSLWFKNEKVHRDFISLQVEKMKLWLEVVDKIRHALKVMVDN